MSYRTSAHYAVTYETDNVAHIVLERLNEITQAQQMQLVELYETNQQDNID